MIRKFKTLPRRPIRFVFSYGSLINATSAQYTADHDIGLGIPVMLRQKAGFRCEWVCFPNDTTSAEKKSSYLGLKSVRRGSQNVFGVLIPVYRNIHKFDGRENVYTRQKLEYDPKDPVPLLKGVYGYTLPQYKFTVYVYTVHTSTSKPRLEYPIRQQYVDTIVLGALEYDPRFVKKVLRNTKSWMGDHNEVYFVNNRGMPYYDRYKIQASNKEYQIVDKYLRNIIPNIFKMRR